MLYAQCGAVQNTASLLVEQSELLDSADSIDSLRGIEGSAASIYFMVIPLTHHK